MTKKKQHGKAVSGAKPRAQAGAATRRRRTPEVARQEILDAAERLFCAHTPDAIGLKEVAREAGVSHALVTHYFGTYAGLVDATFQQRRAVVHAEMLARIQAEESLDPRALLDALFAAIEDPVQLRLWLWALAGDRPGSHDVLRLEAQRLSDVVAALIARGGRARSEADAEALRRRLEMVLMVVVSAAHGWVLVKRGLSSAAGRPLSPELETSFRDTLDAMVRTYLPEPP